MRGASRPPRVGRSSRRTGARGRSCSWQRPPGQSRDLPAHAPASNRGNNVPIHQHVIQEHRRRLAMTLQAQLKLAHRLGVMPRPDKGYPEVEPGQPHVPGASAPPVRPRRLPWSSPASAQFTFEHLGVGAAVRLQLLAECRRQLRSLTVPSGGDKNPRGRHPDCIVLRKL